MLKIDNISFSYGSKTIFKDFSLDINKGDTLWLYGESGCGKTTLLRLLLGLETPLSGTITATRPIRFSAVFQENRLLPFKSALQNILLISKDRQKATELLTELGLGNDLNTPVNRLSGGMKRRVSIARALTKEFDVLILDEPFTGLDKENVTLAANLISKLSADKTIILVTHSQAEAELLGAKQVKL